MCNCKVIHGTLSSRMSWLSFQRNSVEKGVSYCAECVGNHQGGKLFRILVKGLDEVFFVAGGGFFGVVFFYTLGMQHFPKKKKEVPGIWRSVGATSSGAHCASTSMRKCLCIVLEQESK